MDDKRNKILALYDSIDSSIAELNGLIEELQETCPHPHIYETPFQKLKYMGNLDAARICIVCSKYVEHKGWWPEWGDREVEKIINRDEYHKLRERIRPLKEMTVPDM